MPRPELLFFCRNLKTLRQVCGYSKGKMARTCGIGRETLSRLERGDVPPRLSCAVLSRVYEHFGILPSQMLFPWEGEGPPEE